MNNIRWTIGICDDEEYYREEIDSICREYAQKEDIEPEILMFDDGKYVIENEKNIDILFLDIEMQEMGGMDIIKELRMRPSIWRIVFATSHKEESLNGYGSKTIGFLTKPLNKEEVFSCLNMAKTEYLKNEVICFSTDGKERLEHIENIIYLEAMRNYTKVVTLYDEFLIYGTIKYWENELKPINIIRVHKSYLVNLRHIKEIDDATHSIHFRKTEKTLTVGRKYRTQITDRVRKYRLRNAEERLKY